MNVVYRNGKLTFDLIADMEDQKRREWEEKRKAELEAKEKGAEDDALKKEN